LAIATSTDTQDGARQDSAGAERDDRRGDPGVAAIAAWSQQEQRRYKAFFVLT
jgi:hypothetical protein